MHRLDGQHLQSWPIANALNLDWEALALSPTSVFIGDVGNNMGNRSTLAIYRIDRSALLPTTSALAAQKLNFIANWGQKIVESCKKTGTIDLEPNCSLFYLPTCLILPQN